MDYAATWILLLALLAAISVDGFCVLRNLDRHPCEGELNCNDDFGNAIGHVRDWSCRRREVYDYNYGYRRVRTDEDYSLYVKAENIDGTNMFDPFGVVNELKDHILTISITNGKVNSVPSAVYNLQKVRTIDLSGNTIESLNLEAFSKQRSLKMLNVSNNQVADLEVGERSTSGGFSPLTTLDLSHNDIKSIPNNYFRQFAELLHLNLSHNHIQSFDILTFEGITQLQTLYISDNEITTLGLYFARFVFLQELFLDRNYLTSIEESNFNTMAKLEKLNVSYNSLTSIGDKAFDSLVALKELDLSNNSINAITKVMFQRNNNLQSIDISSNEISKIEPGAFEGKNIEHFEIHNNPITGSLVKSTFQGILVEKLDISGANITELGPDLFDGEFQSLNFSRNSIIKIHNTTFSKLPHLTDLDLSYNQLQSIDFDMANLNLSYFYINNNHIKKISKNMFKSLSSLKFVDLSNNEIADIEMLSFEDLNELESLILCNNPLLTVIPAKLFSGLASSIDLDFTNTKINTIQNNAFSGMELLNTFNSSYSNLHRLEPNVFSGTGSIEILDLSYNQIETLSLNNTNMKLVKRIYLQYNKLLIVTDKTFSELTDLRVLSLQGNDLQRIEDEAFHGLNSLLKVDLSANKNMVFNSSIFSNLPSLTVVLLNNVTSGFNFGNVVNSSIAGLDLSFCDITDLNAVQVYQIKTLERLKLASNQIRSIDKVSFQNLRRLSWVDLSYNRLSSIQPGSFSDNEDLSDLDLSNNFLSLLQFGVFDGLVNLKTLDLSTNTLHSFSVSIFHNNPRVEVVYLDNNLIRDLDFEEFAKADIKNLYIGGNPLPCDSLTRLKKNTNVTSIISVKAYEEIYDKENVNGIMCKSKTKIDDLSQNHGNETVLTATLTATLEEFRVTVERFLNRNESKIDLESIGFKDVSTSIDKFLEVFNKSETKNSAFLEKLMNINNSTNRVLENIQEYIKVRSSVSIDDTPKTDVSRVNTDDMEKTMVELLAKEKASMRKEFKGMFDDWASHNVDNNHFEAQSSTTGSTDLKSALYFIATCLAALLCVLVLTSVFVFFKFRSNLAHRNNFSHSRQPISMEME